MNQNELAELAFENWITSTKDKHGTFLNMVMYKSDKHFSLMAFKEAFSLLYPLLEKSLSDLSFYSQGGNPSRDVWIDNELGYFTGKRAKSTISEIEAALKSIESNKGDRE